MKEEEKIKVEHLSTPIYITDVASFSENLTTFRNELVKEYGNCRIGYSLKTNYYEPFLSEVLRLGEMAEIVSPMEYNKALACGFQYSDIIYNGVIPDPITKIRIAEAGGIVNFDNVDELKQASNYCVDPIEVGIRLNFDMKTGVVSRFGVDVDNKEEMAWLLNQSAHPLLRINKLHCHYSGARELYQFRRRVSKMAHFARKFGADTIDIGGNMFGVISPEFNMQYESVVPTLSEYAHAIGSEMKQQFPDESVTLIVEGGTPFVTNAMHLLTKIRNVKTVRGNRYVTVDCRNEDVGWTCRYKEPVIQSLCKGDESLPPIFGRECIKTDIFGSECTETDIIRRNYYGPVESGALLLVRDIGAYSCNLVNDFIKYGCKMFIDKSKLENPEVFDPK